MTETMWLSLIGGLMVLALLGGGLVRRRTPLNEGLRLALLWIAIITVATLAATYGRHLFG